MSTLSGWDYPEVKLDAEHHGPDCKITADGFGRENTRHELPDKQTRYGFPATCRTEPLTGRVYWQARCSMRFPGDVTDMSPLCQIGVASKKVLHGDKLHDLGQKRASLHLTLYTEGSFMKVPCFFNNKTLCDRTLDPHRGVSFDRKFGFLLVTSVRSVSVFDVDAGDELAHVQNEPEMSGPLYPAINLVGEQMRTSSHASVQVEKEEDLHKHTIWEMVKDAERRRV